MLRELSHTNLTLVSFQLGASKFPFFITNHWLTFTGSKLDQYFSVQIKFYKVTINAGPLSSSRKSSGKTQTPSYREWEIVDQTKISLLQISSRSFTIWISLTNGVGFWCSIALCMGGTSVTLCLVTLVTLVYFRGKRVMLEWIK